MTILVLGMHRSGTSVATRLANLLGLAMCRPEDLVRGHGGNERGHWESSTLVAENDRLLARALARWWCPPAGAADIEALAADPAQRGRARQVLDHAYPSVPWVWKDPRTCLTLPFWLSTLDIKPAVILTLRDPLEVAASVRARDGLSPRFALALWERHLRAAVSAAQGLPVLVTTYDAMVADPVAWCHDTVEFLGESGLDVRMPADPAGILAFVHSGLRHHRAEVRHPRGYRLSDEQAALWRLLCESAGGHAHFDALAEPPPETPTTAPLFDEARRAFGFVPGEPGLGGKARSFVSSAGIAVMEGPSPRLRRPEPGTRKVSVVVLGTGATSPRVAPRLRGLLPPEAELIVVEEGEAAEPSAATGAGTHVVRRPGPMSRAERLNLGAEVADGDVLVFLDSPHALPRAGWLEPLVAALDPEVGAAGPVLVPADGDGVPVAGVRPVDPLFNVEWIPASASGTPFPIAGLSLRALATTRRRFEMAGGFDTGMDGVGGEDLDYCLRLWRSGFSCVAVPAAQVEVPFTTEAAADAPRLRNSLRMGLVHLTGDALTEHLMALAGHPLFATALAAVTRRDAGRRRRVVDALAPYGIEGVITALRVPDLGPLLGGGARAAADEPRKEPTPMSTSDEGYRRVNREAWDQLSHLGIESSTPWDVAAMRRPARWLDPFRWLPWPRIKEVLVLGGGGGQQASLLASMGRRVTLVDLSPAQLDHDRAVAERLGLDIECVEADMCDLSALAPRRYDLVYQPVSTCYVPDVRRCYREVAGVLRPGGLYWSQHWNPLHLQLSSGHAWDGTAYRVEHPATDRGPRVLSGPGQTGGPACWHYAHPFADLVGGVCEAGMVIEKFTESGEADLAAEPGSGQHMGAFFAPFYVMLARRRPAAPTSGGRHG
jgi:SAM-dependent methyltransferase